MSSTKTFYTFQQLQDKFRIKMSFLKYHSLIHAIPATYKEQIKAINNAQPQNTFTIDRIMKEEKIAQFVYGELIKRDEVYPEKANEKNKISYNANTNKDSFIELFSIARSCTNSSKLREFQYRLLHNATITNIQLKNWKLKTSYLCSFCNEEPETKSEQILGINNHLPINNLYNHICTTVKHYIYVCRCDAKRPSSETLWLKIKDEMNTEYV